MEFICSDCGKQFQTKAKYNEHKSVHENIELNCNECGKREKMYAKSHEGPPNLCVQALWTQG